MDEARDYRGTSMAATNGAAHGGPGAHAAVLSAHCQSSIVSRVHIFLSSHTLTLKPCLSIPPSRPAPVPPQGGAALRGKGVDKEKIQTREGNIRGWAARPGRGDVGNGEEQWRGGHLWGSLGTRRLRRHRTAQAGTAQTHLLPACGDAFVHSPT